MATASNEVPPGSKAPAIQLDANHHGSWLVICSAFGLVIVLLTLIIRVYLRMRVSPPFAADDIALTAATALSVIQCSLVFAGVHKGDGTSLDLIKDENLVPIQQVSDHSSSLLAVRDHRLTKSPAKLRRQPFLCFRIIHIKDLCCASLQAHLIRHHAQEDFSRRSRRCFDGRCYHNLLVRIAL